jgi:hypothetical protein
MTAGLRRPGRHHYGPALQRRVDEGERKMSSVSSHTQASFHAMRYKGRDSASVMGRKLVNCQSCVLEQLQLLLLNW